MSRYVRRDQSWQQSADGRIMKHPLMKAVKFINIVRKCIAEKSPQTDNDDQEGKCAGKSRKALKMLETFRDKFQ